VLDCTALCISWVFRTGWSLLLTMNTCGQTMFMISCSTNCAAAVVLMLKPTRFSSSAMVAVPPEEDALTAAPLVAGDTATTETLRAPTARAAKADRFNNTFSPMDLSPL